MEEVTLVRRGGILAAQVFALVRACPAGRVTTYSWLAKVIGYPRGARMVGWIMNEAPEDVPAQRVLNSQGELSGSAAFGAPGRMRALLEADGIIFAIDGRVDLRRYGWNPLVEYLPKELRALLDAAAQQPVTLTSGFITLLRSDPASPMRGEVPPSKDRQQTMF